MTLRATLPQNFVYDTSDTKQEAKKQAQAAMVKTLALNLTAGALMIGNATA